MSDSPSSPYNKDRSLEKALTNKIIDDYFGNSESWLRAILRMCIFSMAHLDEQPVLLVECPNQAVAKRLSRKIYPFQDIVYCLTERCDTGDRTLFCYQENSEGSWRCFDTSTNSWKTWNSSQIPTAPTDS
jgi:hypothetical protein